MVAVPSERSRGRAPQGATTRRIDSLSCEARPSLPQGPALARGLPTEVVKSRRSGGTRAFESCSSWHTHAGNPVRSRAAIRRQRRLARRSEGTLLRHRGDFCGRVSDARTRDFGARQNGTGLPGPHRCTDTRPRAIHLVRRSVARSQLCARPEEHEKCVLCILHEPCRRSE